MAEYWRDGYDRPAAEAAINAYEHPGLIEFPDINFWKESGLWHADDGTTPPEGAISAGSSPAGSAWVFARDRTPVVQDPVGLTFVACENPPGAHTAHERVRAFKTGPQGAWFNHVNVNAHDEGGHFTPWKCPDA
ncbi:hypothetical protein [Streptomyces varsoviensis]|uniref:Uncharacterized protein n=1 Tax=Streptomyces varsoviensis TaxID=67373 RepID=A0ABR5IR53_9ACTN|nr:hypothetical protein [Streptomyces varsoviensis]KOG40649.1 hypothetical protein ADK38_46810 [Streptomyces varsoviensis]